ANSIAPASVPSTLAYAVVRSSRPGGTANPNPPRNPADPTAPRRPSTRAATPAPGVSRNSLAGGSRPNRWRPASATALPKWCEESCSTAAASRSTSSGVKPFSASIRSTVGWPTVRVPVLSNTTTRARPSCSIAAPVFTITPASAARLIPAITATGALHHAHDLLVLALLRRAQRPHLERPVQVHAAREQLGAGPRPHRQRFP